MCKHISGVSKVVDEKNNKETPKSAFDMREYNEKGRRNFWTREEWSG